MTIEAPSTQHSVPSDERVLAGPGHWLQLLPGSERQILFLRWLALLLVLILNMFDRSEAGVLFAVPSMALVVAGYNGLLLLLMRFVRWVRRPLNYLAVDTVVASVAVYVTGGYHSSFFVLYVFIIIGVAFHLELVPTVIVTLGIGLVYIGACYLNPAGLRSLYAQYILAAKLLPLLVVALLCSLLLEQLRREHRETERERALALRLRALNELFQQLSTNLVLDLTLQTVAEAPKTLLGADLTSIALLDEGGRKLSVAAAAGFEASEFVGNPLTVDDTFLGQVLASGKPRVIRETARRLDAFPSPVSEPGSVPVAASLVSVPLRSGDEPLGVLNVAYSRLRSFTEEDLAFLHALGQEAALAIRNARLYERERDTVAQLRALEELQEGFVSAVTHELRTPLTCVKTSVELLRATSAGLSKAQVEMVQTIEHHVGRLEALVTDLLETTHLEAGGVSLSKQPTDLRQLVDRVVTALRPLMENKRHVVRLDLPDVLSSAQVDRRRIEQVLTNILSNAAKFTPKEGRIIVAVEETPDHIRVCVSDDGLGIPEEDLGRVFEKFYVVTDGRGLAGLGLGLFICQQMVELHGGRIWAESQVGHGSTFCFEVPKDARED
jgi:signal transduction histidine kinase